MGEDLRPSGRVVVVPGTHEVMAIVNGTQVVREVTYPETRKVVLTVTTD